MKTIYVLIALLALVFASCNMENRSQATGYQGLYSSQGRSYNASGSESGYNADKRSDSRPIANENMSADRMVIYNAYLELTVKKPDSIGKSLSAIAKRYEGFAQTVGTDRAVLRVKSEMLTKALADIATLGKVSGKTISADDVTDSYYDAVIRLDNAKKAREKYLDLMQKAVNVQDMVSIEKELDRLNGEIDLLEGQMKRIEKNVALSTITISIYERKQPGPIGYIFLGLYKVIKFLFVVN